MIGNFMENLPFILSGCVIGIIIFQTAVTAPAVFTVLSGPDASLFLRKIFPQRVRFLRLQLVNVIRNC